MKKIPKYIFNLLLGLLFFICIALLLFFYKNCNCFGKHCLDLSGKCEQENTNIFKTNKNSNELQFDDKYKVYYIETSDFSSCEKKGVYTSANETFFLESISSSEKFIIGESCGRDIVKPLNNFIYDDKNNVYIVIGLGSGDIIEWEVSIYNFVNKKFSTHTTKIPFFTDLYSNSEKTFPEKYKIKYLNNTCWAEVGNFRYSKVTSTLIADYSCYNSNKSEIIAKLKYNEVDGTWLLYEWVY